MPEKKEIVEVEATEVETLPVKTETAIINWNEAATVAKRNRIVRQEIIKDVLKPGIDFGEPFGGASKNVLLKPGAEKITDAFELYTDFDILDQIEDFSPNSPMFYYKFKCLLKLRGTDSIMATGVGSCNIRESKYWWREEKPKCSMCDCDTIFYDGKKDAYYCWTKKGGCGHNFAKDSKGYLEFKKQKTGRIQNPDIFDQVNTVLKMAKKRAHVDAVLNFGFSDKFTQDLEEFGNGIKSKNETSESLPPCPD